MFNYDKIFSYTCWRASFFILYGILKYLNTEGIWKLEHIVSIYGTSCGALSLYSLWISNGIY